MQSDLQAMSTQHAKAHGQKRILYPRTNYNLALSVDIHKEKL